MPNRTYPITSVDEQNRIPQSAMIFGIAWQRWLLIIGTLSIVALAFIPWMSVNYDVMNQTFGFSRPSVHVSQQWYPLMIWVNRFYDNVVHQHNIQLLEPFYGAISTTTVIPGLIGVLWVRGHIVTLGQRIGVAVLTVWGVAMTFTALYSIFIEKNDFAQQFDPYHILLSISWRPMIGAFLALPAFALFWVGMVLLWRDTLRTPLAARVQSIEQQTASGYTSAALVTIGLIVWFVGYYGIYWLLPVGCPPTPLFGSAQCNNRYSGQRGFEQFFHALQTNYVVESLYWLLGAGIVAGGIVAIVAMWLHRQRANEVVPLCLWIVSLIVLSGISYWGAHQLAILQTDEQWTNGPLVTMVGIIVIASGLALRSIHALRHSIVLSS